jgi:hypothetical protein
MSLLDYKVLQYRPPSKMVVADDALREQFSKMGMRVLMRRTHLSQHTLEAILKGQAVRRATLERARAALNL